MVYKKDWETILDKEGEKIMPKQSGDYGMATQSGEVIFLLSFQQYRLFLIMVAGFFNDNRKLKFFSYFYLIMNIFYESLVYPSLKIGVNCTTFCKYEDNKVLLEELTIITITIAENLLMKPLKASAFNAMRSLE